MGLREEFEKAREKDPKANATSSELWAGLRETLSKLNFFGRLSKWFEKNVMNFRSNIDGH